MIGKTPEDGAADSGKRGGGSMAPDHRITRFRHTAFVLIALLLLLAACSAAAEERHTVAL